MQHFGVLLLVVARRLHLHLATATLNVHRKVESLFAYGEQPFSLCRLQIGENPQTYLDAVLDFFHGHLLPTEVSGKSVIQPGP
jgi:hypothetical protein